MTERKGRLWCGFMAADLLMAMALNRMAITEKTSADSATSYLFPLTTGLVLLDLQTLQVVAEKNLPHPVMSECSTLWLPLLGYGIILPTSYAIPGMVS